MKRVFALVLGLLMSAAVVAGEKPAEKDMALEADKANHDFKLQGEYSGEIEGGKGKLGAQVIALGDGNFNAVFYPGGLPGDGWVGETGNKQKFAAAGKAENNKISVAPPPGNGYSATFDGDTGSGQTDAGAKFTLKTVMRKSPTEGAKPPEGAVMLFDGSSADAWNNGRLDERKLLKAGCVSKQAFGDFTLHVEFQFAYKPHGRGQDRGNSGVYLQNRYECQVLDSFGLEGRNNECGGIYTKAEPKVNMCFPPLSWQTYDMEFTAAKFDDKGVKTKNAVLTVKHNGFLIHDKLEINGKTGGGQEEGPTPGPIQTQDHGNPVFYRNVWVVEKK